MPAPLEGMKILDFTYLLPGPFGTMMISDLGADIIKVENPESPDIVRLMPPHTDGMSALYAHLNRGKRSLSLNLKKAEAREIVLRLVRDYDVVIEQFRPGTMDRLGLGYADLSKVNPSIIYCSLTGYGQTGSYADRAGHDINYMALSGVDSISGRRETGPVLTGIQVADIASGSKNLVIGVMAAFIGRQRTGAGNYIDVSITDGVFAMSVFATAGYLAGGKEPVRGDFLSGGALYDYYRTSDGGYLSVGPIEQKFFFAFCDCIGVRGHCADRDNQLEQQGARGRGDRGKAACPLARGVPEMRRVRGAGIFHKRGDVDTAAVREGHGRDGQDAGGRRGPTDRQPD